jgi:hypothetical protein
MNINQLTDVGGGAGWGADSACFKGCDDAYKITMGEICKTEDEM